MYTRTLCCSIHSALRYAKHPFISSPKPDMFKESSRYTHLSSGLATKRTQWHCCTCTGIRICYRWPRRKKCARAVQHVLTCSNTKQVQVYAALGKTRLKLTEDVVNMLIDRFFFFVHLVTALKFNMRIGNECISLAASAHKTYSKPLSINWGMR